MLVFTGGSGRIGRAIRRFFPDAYFPTRDELNILNHDQCEQLRAASLVVHLAAVTGDQQCLQDRQAAWQTNVAGTLNVLTAGVPILLASTNVVFSGRKGNYSVYDTPDPITFYGHTKAEAEKATLAHDGKVMRFTAFARPFPFPRAASDLFSSAGYLDEIAAAIATAVNSFDELGSVTHIGGRRISVLNLAKQTCPSIEPVTAEKLEKELGCLFPRDTSFIDAVGID